MQSRHEVGLLSFPCAAKGQICQGSGSVGGRVAACSAITEATISLKKFDERAMQYLSICKQYYNTP